MRWIEISRIYSQGRGFQLAAERCMEERENCERRTLPIQAIVCYAFTCELYLKAIYLFENPSVSSIHGHSLEVLFSRLSGENQKRILSYLEEYYPPDVSINLIKDCSKLFEEFRYIYETEKNEHMHVGFVYSFSEALYKVVCESVIIEVKRNLGLGE